MSEACTHNCETCGQDCGQRTAPRSMVEKANPGSDVKKVIGVVSGKGGVGKSLVSAMLAVAMERKGYHAGILDGDITGPSIPKMFGVQEKARGNGQGILPVKTKSGVDIMSINLLLENESDPVVWRGPVIATTVKQFWTDVVWGEVDYLFVDMPPGTGDVALNVFQSIPLDGIVIVASPQELVSMVVEKAVKMAEMMNIPIVGLVENMSYLLCPDCGREIPLFGQGRTQAAADAHHLPLLARMPIDPALAQLTDEGRIEDHQSQCLTPVIEAILQ